MLELIIHLFAIRCARRLAIDRVRVIWRMGRIYKAHDPQTLVLSSLCSKLNRYSFEKRTLIGPLRVIQPQKRVDHTAADQFVYCCHIGLLYI